MKVRKAVIVAAGMGTRMLPASKVVPKEILPVVDKPAIQMVVEEAVASGIEEMILVLSPGRTTVLEHFQSAPELESLLERRLKHDLLEIVRYTNNLARFSTAHQDEPLGLGHAVLQAHEAVGDEPFAVILPDGAGPEGGWHSDAPRMEEVTLKGGTRHAAGPTKCSVQRRSHQRDRQRGSPVRPFLEK